MIDDGLSEGYFKDKLPHQARSLHGQNLGDITRLGDAGSRCVFRMISTAFPSPSAKRSLIGRRVGVSSSPDMRQIRLESTFANALSLLWTTAGSALCCTQPRSRVGASISSAEKAEFGRRKPSQ
ncbi:hypothetical protein [Neorhizobium sp. JUb45]|uniref:hypothetical protein n=1 Tax=Neorhizobium sp. JUb45 TaxID=2485113 RepID=UPI001A9DF807|nr:hypothetical protein [Neorhizobium sp. JUb45]